MRPSAVKKHLENFEGHGFKGQGQGQGVSVKGHLVVECGVLRQ